MLSKVSLAFAVVVVSALLGCGSGTSGSNGSSSQQGVPLLSLSTASLSFPATTVGQTSAAQSITLTNSGSATVTLTSASLSDTADYALMTTCGASLSVSASCTLTVQFKPQSGVSLPAAITLSDNVTGSPQTISLSGTGTAATVPQASLSPAAGVTFTTTAIGVTAPTQTVTLSNTGNAALAIASINVGGANPAVFAATNTCGASLAAGAACSISVAFTPVTASTNYAATLTVTDNAGGVGGSTQSVSLSGSGGAAATGPLATLTSTSLSFAGTTLGRSTAAQSITLTNNGGSTLSGIAISLTGAGSASFSSTSTCGSTLPAGSNCSISVVFAPVSVGSISASIGISDNAAGSPQTVSLSGTGTGAVASFSATSISFPATKVATTSAVSSVTLTNTGNAPLNIAGIVLGGTNAANFTETTTCGATLAAAASCTIGASFSPVSQVGYTANITVTVNAAGSPQVIGLSGTGTASAVTYTLYTFPESDNSVTPLYALINSATQTIDMTMYELQDSTFTGDLVAACSRGVKVRVVLSSSESSSNASAFSQLNSAGANCSAVQSNTAFVNTHQKTFTIDGSTTVIMSLNLQTQYYSTTRDFAMVENDPNDIAAIEATFNQDYAAGKPSGGTQGPSDFSYQPGAGDGLIWSPTTATADMLAIINNATTSIVLENEEMSASNIVSALEAACRRGVTVHIAMVANSSYNSNFTALKAAGCGVNLYPNTTNGFYVHAKAVVADYGLSTQTVYMGSINYSTASLTENRELGLFITDSASVQTLYTTMSADYAGGTPY